MITFSFDIPCLPRTGLTRARNSGLLGMRLRLLWAKSGVDILAGRLARLPLLGAKTTECGLAPAAVAAVLTHHRTQSGGDG